MAFGDTDVDVCVQRLHCKSSSTAGKVKWSEAERWNTLTKKKKKSKKQQWDGIKEGEVWVKFMLTAPESRGEEEWED